jgi:hypothetical protein
LKVQRRAFTREDRVVIPQAQSFLQSRTIAWDRMDFEQVVIELTTFQPAAVKFAQ